MSLLPFANRITTECSEARFHNGFNHVVAANEVRDEFRRRPFIDLSRCVYLMNSSGIEHRDTVAHPQRFFLIVSDVDGRDRAGIVNGPQHGPCFSTELGIEIRERFIQQQQLRLNHQSARQCDTLLLSAGKLVDAGST